MNINIPKFVFSNTEDAKNVDAGIKFGGIPVGLPEDQWPICADCGSSMSLLLQMQHHRERLPLGKEGRVLYLF